MINVKAKLNNVMTQGSVVKNKLDFKICLSCEPKCTENTEKHF